MKKFTALLLAILMIAVILAGCAANDNVAKDNETEDKPNTTDTTNDTDTPDEDAPPAEELHKIAFLSNSSTDEFLNYMFSIYERDDQDYGLETIFFDAQTDTQTQANQVSEAIGMGVEAIVINPNDAAGLGPALKEAYEAGLIVMTVVGDIAADYHQYRTCFIGTDDNQAGDMAADLFLKQFPNGGKIVVVDGEAGYDAQIKRHDSFFAKIENSNIEILDWQACTFWDPAEAQAIMEDFIIAYGDQIEGAFIQWDHGAEACVESLEAAGLDDVFVVSIDGASVGVDMVKEGKTAATILQDVDLIAATSMETLQKLFAGEKVDSIINPPVATVTIENANDYDPQW